MHLYIIINNINGKVYGGMTTKTGWEYDRYMGSGKIIQQAHKKYGLNNFTKRTINIPIKDLDHLSNLEIKLIRRLKRTFKHNCYNLHKGGTGGDKCRYMVDRTWVNKKISEGKKKQYTKGQTQAQLDGRKKQSQSLKQTNKSNPDKVKERQKRRGRSQTKRVQKCGLTEKEKQRNTKVKLRNTRIVTVKLSYPSGKQIMETMSIGEYVAKYNIETTVISLARKSHTKQFIFKRRTSRTNHPFPENTILTILKETIPE